MQVLLEQAADNIRAAATALVAGQKEAIETQVARIKAEQEEVLTRAEQLLQAETVTVDTSSKVGDLPESVPALVLASVHEAALVSSSEATVAASTPTVPIGQCEVATNHPSAQDDKDWAERLLNEAHVTVALLRLRDGATGWPFEKIFPQSYLKGALKVCLIDPYLAKPHQIRNLREFLLHLAEKAQPKEIEVVTGFAAEPFAERQDRSIDAAAKDLFNNYGVTLTLRRDTVQHDRYLILDHGVLFKLGRGLDIYKPAVGLAEHRSANRRVRETHVDVFCRPGHALAMRGKNSPTGH